MKKILLFVLLISISNFAQEITSTTDEFTNITTISTSWEKFFKKKSTTASFKFSKTNNIIYLDIKLILNNGVVFAVGEDFKLIFKCEDGSTYTYYSKHDVVSDIGRGSTGFYKSALYGAQLAYLNTSDPYFNTLLSKKPIKLRIYTDEGYVDAELKSKNIDLLLSSIKLINSI